jgi:hypothetical protein
MSAIAASAQVRSVYAPLLPCILSLCVLLCVSWRVITLRIYETIHRREDCTVFIILNWAPRHVGVCELVVKLHAFLTSVLDRRELPASRPSRIIPQEWAPVWVYPIDDLDSTYKTKKYLALLEIDPQFPDFPTGSLVHQMWRLAIQYAGSINKSRTADKGCHLALELSFLTVRVYLI